MQIIGTVVSVETEISIEKNGGGTYQGSRLTYRAKKDGKIQEQCWHEQALKYNADVANTLSELVAGEVFTMEKEKNDKGFWNVLSITLGEAAPKANATSPAKANGGGGSNTYPTAEERAKTQTSIQRQNSVTNAVAFIVGMGNKKASVEEVLQIAAQFEQFVVSGQTSTSVNKDDLDSGIE